MASVRDRYRGILVENVRISDVSGCGSARAVSWDLGAWAPTPGAVSRPALSTYLSHDHIAPTLCHL